MSIEGTKTDLEGVRLGQVQSHGAPVKALCLMGNKSAC